MVERELLNYMDEGLRKKIRNKITKEILDITNIGNARKTFEKMGFNKIYEKIMSFPHYFDADNHEKMVENLLCNKPLDFMNYIFDIDKVKEKYKIYLGGGDYNESIRQGRFSGNVQIKDFSLITYVDLNRVECLDNEKNDWTNEAELSLAIESCNYFAGNIYYSGNFRDKDLDYYTLTDDLTTIITLDIWGIKKENNLPIWVQYLLDSAANAQAGNLKMAFFNAFASLDKYIELMYDTLFDVYQEGYSYFLSLDNTEETKEELKQKIRNYANVNRRLIDEKLLDCDREREGIISNEFREIRKELQKLEKIRNSIAHGDEVKEVIDYAKIAHLILNLIAVMNGYKMIEDILE